MESTPPTPLLSERNGAGNLRPPLAVLVACATAILLGILCAAGADAATPTRCTSLTGKRLVSSHTVKVVERGTPARGVVYICVPPHGLVRVAGSAFSAIPGEPNLPPDYSIQVLAVSGTWVAIAYRSLVDAHGSEEIEKVSDGRSGRSYRFFEAGIPEGPGLEMVETGDGVVERVVLNRFGQLAFALNLGIITQIFGVEANGAKRLLGSAPTTQIPLASLKIVGHTVEWLDAGAADSAVL
jgi:hypothetical protein